MPRWRIATRSRRRGPFRRRCRRFDRLEGAFFAADARGFDLCDGPGDGAFADERAASGEAAGILARECETAPRPALFAGGFLEQVEVGAVAAAGGA